VRKYHIRWLRACTEKGPNAEQLRWARHLARIVTGEPTKVLVLISWMGEEPSADQNSGGFVVYKESKSSGRQ
jgi:hypothetical protein